MFSLLRTSLGSPVRRSRESAFAMLPLVHKQAIPSRCGVGYTAPFEQAKHILPDPMSDHEAAVHADRQLLNFSGLLFRNDRHVIDLQTLEHLRSMVARFWIEESTLQLEATTQFMKLLFQMLEHLQSMVARVWSEESALQLEATSQFMKLLSNERSPPIEEVIQSGVPRFVEFLMRKYFPQLQFVAAWALTNFSYGISENTNVVIDHGVVPIFAKLLSYPSDDVHEQAVWALGNVAGDSPECCDIVLGIALRELMVRKNEVDFQVVLFRGRG